MNNKGKKMAVMPVRRLLLNMAAPMMISMLGQALYNVVDTFFVSHMQDTAAVSGIGDKAINALTLAFPVQMLIMALGVGTGVGINAVIARALGEKDVRRAERTAGNAMFMAVIYGLAMLVFGLFFARIFIASQTSSPVIRSMGTTYLRIVTIFAFGSLGYMCLEKIVIATGRTTITMVCQLAGALTNIVLDPILIYGLLGLPSFGVAGAVAATVIGQWVSLIIIAVMFFNRKGTLHVKRSDWKPVRSILAPVYQIGFPAIIMQLLVPVMSYGMNLILGTVSESAVTAYGVYYKLQNFIFMPAYGLNNASIPIISFNYGAGSKERIKGTIRFALFVSLLIMTAGVVLFQIWTGQIVGIFSVTDETRKLCIDALRIISWGFFLAGVNIILQGVCQALGNGMYSLLISLLRLVAITLPLAFLLARTADAQFLVWFSVPAGEAAAAVTASVLTIHLFRRRMKEIMVK